MDKEYLQEYEINEINNFRKYLAKTVKDESDFESIFPPKIHYPDSNRLELKEPYSESIKTKQIWPLVPLYGTTIISLFPRNNPKDFEMFHGFEIEDIDRLINFSKDTGKIKFIIAHPPSFYENINYLKPIFEELKPPFVPVYDWVEHFIGEKEVFDWACEANNFVTDRRIIQKLIDDEKRGGPDAGNRAILYKNSYVFLRIAGLHSLADEILSFSDPEIALNTLTIVEMFIIEPLTSTLGGIRSYDRNLIELQRYFMKFSHNIEFPFEIGKFLNDELKLIIPKNISGAIELSEEYEQNDLHNVMNDLNKAVNNENVNEVNEKSSEISTIFSNTWDSTNKLKKKIDYLEQGSSLGVAVLGSLSTMQINSSIGLLAGLGITVVEKLFLKNHMQNISEKIVKSTYPSYMVHIYDFKKKYHL